MLSDRIKYAAMCWCLTVLKMQSGPSAVGSFRDVLMAMERRRPVLMFAAALMVLCRNSFPASCATTLHSTLPIDRCFLTAGTVKGLMPAAGRRLSAFLTGVVASGRAGLVIGEGPATDEGADTGVEGRPRGVHVVLRV